MLPFNKRNEGKKVFLHNNMSLVRYAIVVTCALFDGGLVSVATRCRLGGMTKNGVRFPYRKSRIGGSFL